MRYQEPLAGELISSWHDCQVLAKWMTGMLLSFVRSKKNWNKKTFKSVNKAMRTTDCAPEQGWFKVYSRDLFLLLFSL